MASTFNCDAWNPRPDYYEWSKHSKRTVRLRNWEGTANQVLEELWEMPTREAKVGVCKPDVSLGKCFLRLASDWSENTRHISSASDLTSHPSYQEIIKLGWDVVPFLLNDLQQNKRFWFPALHAITKVRPFDPSDAGNSRRMTDAWVRWGKRKGLI